jgi:uncharacterized protein YbdZ (MbtH family)
MGTSDYGVIVNPEHQFGIWSTTRRLPPGWRFLGPTGSHEEMKALLGDQFVETVAAPLITPGRLPRVTQFSE